MFGVFLFLVSISFLLFPFPLFCCFRRAWRWFYDHHSQKRITYALYFFLHIFLQQCINIFICSDGCVFSIVSFSLLATPDTNLQKCLTNIYNFNIFFLFFFLLMYYMATWVKYHYRGMAWLPFQKVKCHKLEKLSSYCAS